ncbi:hypothetical protein GO491_04015 [Flavobacteriaceae bacterium Ap0902]|nr:hypothetical protein [Flavobacteriaceae bacterium Ap0902]
MRYITITLIALITLTSCNKGGYIALRDAERGMFLDRANKVSINTFFDRRMESELESNYRHDWQIVNEDLEYIYFGTFVEKNGFTIVSPFYKVDREKLTERFPGFRSIEGKHIKAKVFQSFVKPIIDSRLLTLCPQSYNVQYGKRSYKLTDQGIESSIDFTGRCYEDKIFTAKVNILLDPSNIEVLDSDTNYR